MYMWLVVWNIFYFSIYWEYSSHLTNIFQRGWNHQPDILFLHTVCAWNLIVTLGLKVTIGLNSWTISAPGGSKWGSDAVAADREPLEAKQWCSATRNAWGYGWNLCFWGQSFYHTKIDVTLWTHDQTMMIAYLCHRVKNRTCSRAHFRKLWWGGVGWGGMLTFIATATT